MPVYTVAPSQRPSPSASHRGSGAPPRQPLNSPPTQPAPIQRSSVDANAGRDSFAVEKLNGTRSDGTKSNGSKFNGSKFNGQLSSGPKPEPKILHQTFFKSAGPRTYAAQVKQAANGNHFLVLTEGKRDPKTDELRKTSLYLFSEDFQAFFDLLREVEKFTQENPVSPEVAKRQVARWSKSRDGNNSRGK